VKKATRKPKSNFRGLQEFIDRLPEIVALMNPEPLPQLPCTPYKPPPDRWVFGRHLAVNMTNLLRGADSVELFYERASADPVEARAPCLYVHRGGQFLRVGFEHGMVDSMTAVLREMFPEWAAAVEAGRGIFSWPDYQPELKPPSKQSRRRSGRDPNAGVQPI
jgi:hypothetical protein